MLIEGLGELDLQVLDAQEATHLPRETVYVEPFAGEVVPAQIYRRQQGQPRGQAVRALQDGGARAGLPLGLGGLREPLPRHGGRGRQPAHVRLSPPRPGSPRSRAGSGLAGGLS